MPENEGERKAENTNLHIARLAPLLDFYSDRATAHASLFVASIFGILTMLAIVQGLNGFVVWPSIFVYFALTYAGYFTLVRFNFYAGIAHKLNEILENIKFTKDDLSKKEEKLFEDLEDQIKRQRRILIFKEFTYRLGKGGFYLFGSLYWGLTFSIGLIVYSQVLDCWIKWIIWIIIFMVLTLLFVILPFREPAFYSRIFEYLDDLKKKRGW